MWVPPQLAADQEFEIAIDDTRWNHRIAPGKSSKVTLPLVRTAGEKVALHVRARQTFAPNRDGTSGDDRNLAWRLISAVLEHK
jgi:hypothetical protein